MAGTAGMETAAAAAPSPLRFSRSRRHTREQDCRKRGHGRSTRVHVEFHGQSSDPVGLTGNSEDKTLFQV
jgi:hypothetical protein